MLLSICIPTYNRATSLANCLNSIKIAQKFIDNIEVEVCISDNASDDNTEEVVKSFEKEIKIKYLKNYENLGFAKNAIKVVSAASGEFSWLIGDDDLIIPTAFQKISKLIQDNSEVDYFFINSYHLNSNYIKKFEMPFDTNNLKFDEMTKISNLNDNKKVKFWEIINQDVSWDFLIGIFLSVFRTKKWINSLSIIDINKIKDTGVWSTFENTCLHPIIIANAFKNSESYICSEPLSVNLIGEREWGDLYEFVEIIRIPELLDYYKSQGMPVIKYFSCKNYSLRNFSSYFFKILIGGKKKGRNYVNFKKHFFNNLFFPNIYISILTFFVRKLKSVFKIFKS